MPLDALCHQIHAAMVALVNRLERVVLSEVPRVRRWKRMRTGRRQIEIPTQSQQRIADRFGIESLTREAGKPFIRGILFDRCGSSPARHAITARQHDPAMQRLDRPAAFTKLRGEIVEQFRMRWRLSLLAKIIGSSARCRVRSDAAKCDWPSRAQAADFSWRQSTPQALADRWHLILRGVPARQAP